MRKIKIFLFVLSFLFLTAVPGFSGASFDALETDTSNELFFGFFDLRNRETYIQITNVDLDPTGHNVHIQFFDVSNDCNENNFFDFYTPNDTHIYNVRDIQTNDGNDSGVILPDGAYGIFVAFGAQEPDQVLIGNLRILDNNGYEYRTNLVGTDPSEDIDILDEFATFNFNTAGGVILSDIVLIAIDDDAGDDQEAPLAAILDVWATVDVDIYDLNENPFSCRKIIFSCVNQESSLYEALLEEAANEQDNECNGNCGASVADIEYGINNAIPHSKGGELLCPGNIISEGIVRLEKIGEGDETDDESIIYIGLNNGNGRGSMDAIFTQNSEIGDDDDDDG